MSDLVVAVRRSPEFTHLAKAIATAQGKIQPATKDKVNTHFKNSYADLASCWEACRTQLSEQGIAVIQCPNTRDNRLWMDTLLAHESGQWVESSIEVPLPQQVNAQVVGSSLTYMRRYSLCAMVGVAPADDDDGNEASKNVGRIQPEQQNGNGRNQQQQQRPAGQQANGNSGQQGASNKPPVRVTIDPHGDEMKSVIAALDQAGLTEPEAKYEFASAVLGRRFQDNPRITQAEADAIKAAAAQRAAELNEVPG